LWDLTMAGQLSNLSFPHPSVAPAPLYPLHENIT
jgi:hypothetical protein